VGDRECLWDTGLLGSVSHLCHGSIGDSSGDKVYVWPSGLLRLQWALIVQLVLRLNWWQVLEEVERL